MVEGRAKQGQSSDAEICARSFCSFVPIRFECPAGQSGARVRRVKISTWQVMGCGVPESTAIHVSSTKKLGGSWGSVSKTVSKIINTSVWFSSGDEDKLFSCNFEC